MECSLSRRASEQPLGLELQEKSKRIVFKGKTMLKFLLWCILLVMCWPLALLALIAYPFVWLLLLPFRVVGITVEGVFALLKAILLLPARVLRGPSHA